MNSRTIQRVLALSTLTLVFIASAVWQGGVSPVQADRHIFEGMPQPEAMPMPYAETAQAAAEAVVVKFGATTVRLRATAHKIYRFSTTGKQLQQRTIRLARPRVWSAPADEYTFGSGRYVKLTSGPYSGWYVTAAGTVAAAATSFTPELTVTVRAGKLVARRFFGPVVTRRTATLSSPTTFKASKRAVFSGATHYLISDGSLAGRWVIASRIIVPSSGDSKAPAPTASPSPTAQPTAAPQADPVTTWKTVVLLYRETDLVFKRANGTDYRLKARMDDTMYNLVRKTLGQFAKSAGTWSGGMAAMDLTIIDMPHPLDRVDPLGSSYWVGPQSIWPDLNEYVPIGAWDSVIVVYQPTDSKGVSIPIGGWGLTIPDGVWSKGAGFSSVVTPHELWWWTGSSAPEEVFIHEWMHQVLFFHERHNRVSLDLHAGDKYGYKDKDGSWKTWLVDVMQGKVKDGNKMIGVSGDVWAAGKPSAP